MPNYRTHVTVNLAVGLPLALATLQYTASLTVQETFSFTGAFIYGTLFLHPDLDLAYKTKLFSLRGLLTLPFRPYSYLFRHRGVSHMPIIGTLTRLLWLLGLFWALFWIQPHFSKWHYIWFIISGFTVADLYHIILDKLK